MTVCDLFPPVNAHIDDSLLPEYSQYLESKANLVVPKPEWITVYHGDIRTVPDSIRLGPFDLVLSSSVYEHLDDVDGITAALSRLLKPSGHFVAYIDLTGSLFQVPIRNVVLQHNNMEELAESHEQFEPIPNLGLQEYLQSIF